MLILVAVTVNIANENGGLFEKTREAKSDTAYRAEEENLLIYIYGEDVYDATMGKVNLNTLKKQLDEESDKWKSSILDSEENPTKLTVTGAQSGIEHVVLADGTLDGNKKNQPKGEFSFKNGPMESFCLNPNYNSDGQITKDFWTDLSLEDGKSFDLNDNSGELAFEGGVYNDENSNVYLCFSNSNGSYYYSFDKIDIRGEYENNNLIVEGTGWYTKDDDGFHQLTNPENVIFESINVSLSEDYLIQINKHFAQVFKFV